MSVALQKAGAAQPTERPAPHNLDDHALMVRLVTVQARARDMMREYSIASGNVSVMAWQAEQSIADPTLRAEFLRLLIDLHEFGRQARQRGLLNATKAKAEAPEAAKPTEKATNLFASDEEGADMVSTDATRAFFKHLDR